MKIIQREEILRLNCPGYGQESYFSLGRARPLESYRVMIVNPISILHLFDRAPDVLKQIEAAQSDGLTSLSLASNNLLTILNNEITARTEQLVKFLEKGGLLIYYLCRPFLLQASDLSLDNYSWLLSLAPDNSSERNARNMSTVANGRNIELTEEATESEFFHYFDQSGLEWSTIIRTDFLTDGYTALATAGPKKCIAGELYAGDQGGRIVFLPAPYSPEFDCYLLECIHLWLHKSQGLQVSLEEISSTVARLIEEAKQQPKPVSSTAQPPNHKSTASVTEQSNKNFSSTNSNATNIGTSTSSASNTTNKGPVASSPKASPGPTNSPPSTRAVPPPAAKPQANPNSLTQDSLTQAQKAPAAPTPRNSTNVNTVASQPQLNTNKIPQPSSLRAALSVSPSEVALKAENLVKELEQSSTSSGGIPGPSPVKKATSETNGENPRKNLPETAKMLPANEQSVATSEGNSNAKAVNTYNTGIKSSASAAVSPTHTDVSSLANLSVTAPAWCLNFSFPGLDDLRKERITLSENLKQTQAKIQLIDNRIGALETVKNIMLAGDGNALTECCMRALTAFGWGAKRSHNADNELWLAMGETPEALARIVCSTAQPKRSDLAQLAESVITFWGEYEHEPKGLLIACTWATTPPTERIEPDYPESMAEFAQKKNICLISTSQLLCAYRDIELGKRTANEMRKRLLETSGRLQGFQLEFNQRTG